MQRQYKELLITDEMNIARAAKAEGKYVVLSYPVHGMTEQDSLSDYPYVVETESEPEITYLEHVLCRFRGEPCHILDTQRCRIREITPADVERLYEIYADPQITEFMEALYENPEDEIEYTKEYIRCHYGFYDFGMWIVEEKQTGKIIGRAGFDMRQGYEHPELGFMICKDYQRQGYATEICKHLLSYGKDYLGFGKVGSFTHSDNEASIRLLTKLGFTYQGRETVDSVKDNKEDFDYYLKML